MNHTKHIAPTVAALVLLGTLLMLARVAPVRTPRSTVARTLHLSPGGSATIPVGGNTMHLDIPQAANESASYGTFRITLPDSEFDSGQLERDGILESVFVDDVNSDAINDAVIIIRSVGSGSYVTIYCVLSNAAGYSVSTLPEPPSAIIPNYQGHDTVAVNQGTISRIYPAYDDSNELRLDRQWSPHDLIWHGKSPVKATPDSNAAPSGRNVRVTYSHETGSWK